LSWSNRRSVCVLIGSCNKTSVGVDKTNKWVVSEKANTFLVTVVVDTGAVKKSLVDASLTSTYSSDWVNGSLLVLLVSLVSLVVALVVANTGTVEKGLVDSTLTSTDSSDWVNCSSFLVVLVVVAVVAVVAVVGVVGVVGVVAVVVLVVALVVANTCTVEKGLVDSTLTSTDSSDWVNCSSFLVVLVWLSVSTTTTVSTLDSHSVQQASINATTASTDACHGVADGIVIATRRRRSSWRKWSSLKRCAVVGDGRT